MPKSRTDRFVFTILVLASLAVMAYLSRKGYASLQEAAFQTATDHYDDYAASRALQKGAFAGHPGRLQTLCDIAFQDNYPNTTAALMRMGFTPHDGTGRATVVSAAGSCPAVLPLFLDRGEPVDTRDSLGRTALMVVVNGARTDHAKLLLDRGADLNARDLNGDTALMRAGTLECANLLIERGADVNARDARGGTPLAFRSRDGNSRLVEFLLSKGAHIEGEPLRPAVLAEALRVGRENSTRPLGLSPALRMRANELPVRMSPLCEATYGSRAEVIDMLLKRGAGRADRSDALSVALSSDRADCVRTMLAHGGRPDPANPAWRLAVQIACRNAYVDVLELLRPYGVAAAPTPSDIESLNQNQQTPLHVSLAAHNITSAELLIQKHAKVNVADAYGRTPLLVAIEKCPEVVDTLLAHHADPNVVSADGDTALKLAVIHGDCKMVRSLLAHGANANLCRPALHTPMYYARKHRYTEMIALLEQAGGREE